MARKQGVHSTRMMEATAIIDQCPDLSSITPPRMMFTLGLVKEATGHFIQHVLRTQRLLADRAVK